MQRLISLVLIVTLGLAVVAREASSQQAPDRIAFVDVRQAFREYTKRQTVLNSLQSRQGALKSRIQADVDRAEALSQTLKTLNKEAPEYSAKMRELALLQAQIQFDEEEGLRSIQRDATYQEGLMYKEIVAAVEVLGRNRGYGAVLQSAPLPQDFAKTADIELVTATRTVVWSDPRNDLTRDLINQLNGR